MMKPYFDDLRAQQMEVEARLVAQGVPIERIDWVYESEDVAGGVMLRASPRLRTDDEMVGRCTDSSCCG